MRIGVAEQRLDLAGQPCPLMDAVRDRRDRHLLDSPSGHKACHIPRDTSPWSFDTPFSNRDVRKANGVSPNPRLGGIDLPERREVLPGQTAPLDEIADVPPDELRVEHLVARRDWRVRREDGRDAQPLERLIGRQPVPLDALPQPFELEEGRVALVDMEDGRREAELAENAHTADPEHELLPQPVLAVAAVESVRDVARPVGLPSTFVSRR